MTTKTRSYLRKNFGLICSIFLYYIVHEGSHVLIALLFGALKGIKITGFGIQVIADIDNLTDFKLGIFCIVGSISTLIVGYTLVLLIKKIVIIKNKIIKSVCYYTTLVFLLLDPLYLTIIYKFVGGGDMNGIKLFGLKEIIIQFIYGFIIVINIYIIIKKVYPQYKENFNE